ncbi:MAG: class I SAM-dependent methyltransferase [Patescibacteria group bacterium]
MRIFSKVNFFSSFSFPFFIRLFIFLGVYEKGWGFYQLGREKDRSFLPAKHFSRLVKKNSKILDAGCASGAFLSTVGKRANARNIAAIDTSLPGLYLAKKYFSPRANFIYLDLNDKLPFKDSHFDYVFSNDAFHYVKQQKRLAGELRRIISNQGTLVLTNLHNKYYSKEFKGQSDYPQTPEAYISLFGQKGTILFSEYPLMKISTNQAKKLKKFTLLYSLSNHFQRLYSSTSHE